KDRNPNLVVAQFWHIPWPTREVFRGFPWKEELLDGILGNDLLGFHLRLDCQNFLDTVDNTFEARVDRERFEVTRTGKATTVRSWRPIILLKKHFPQKRLVALHRLAHFCAVTSLHDGMNLVAKEFVASRTDSDGVLVLSDFAGASRELTDAVIVNPFNEEQVA